MPLDMQAVYLAAYRQCLADLEAGSATIRAPVRVESRATKKFSGYDYGVLEDLIVAGLIGDGTGEWFTELKKYALTGKGKGSRLMAIDVAQYAVTVSEKDRACRILQKVLPIRETATEHEKRVLRLIAESARRRDFNEIIALTLDFHVWERERAAKWVTRMLERGEFRSLGMAMSTLLGKSVVNEDTIIKTKNEILLGVEEANGLALDKLRGKWDGDDLDLGDCGISDVTFLNRVTIKGSLDLRLNQLTSVTLPSGLSIGGTLDLGCNKLASIEIQDGVRIGKSLFLQYNPLTTVKIHSSASIGEDLLLEHTGVVSMSAQDQRCIKGQIYFPDVTH